MHRRLDTFYFPLLHNFLYLFLCKYTSYNIAALLQIIQRTTQIQQGTPLYVCEMESLQGEHGTATLMDAHLFALGLEEPHLRPRHLVDAFENKT